MANTTTAAFTEIARVIVPVSDFDAAIAFYRDKLGFELVGDTPFGDGERWVELALPGARTTIAFGPPMRDNLGGPTGISFRAPDVTALHAELRARDVDVDDLVRMPEPAPPAMFFFRDQDGNTLHVAEERL